MKNLSFIIISIIALTTFSCQREDVQKNGELITITATQQGLPDLKTNIGAPGTYGVTWNATDNLAVFDGTGLNKNVPFNYSSGAGTQSGTFSGTITGWTSGSKTFYGVYPYNIANATSHSAYGLTIPTAQTQDFTNGATQYAHLGLYDFMAAAPVTVTKSGADQPTIDFNFQHLMAILDIEVTNSTGGAVTVTKISIKRAGNDFAATANLDLTKDPGSNYASATKTNQLDLTITNAVSTGSDEKFTGSLIVAPVDLTGSTDFIVTAGGLTYTVTKSTNTMEAGKRYKSAITIVPSTLTDSRDSKVYKTVKIGTQTWMAENLNFVPASGSSWCYDNSSSNCDTYGKLYDWTTATADTHGNGTDICPDGWHLPLDDEFTTLTTFLAGELVAGGPLKETGATHWTIQSPGATNSSGFTALPGGYRVPFGGGIFDGLGTVAYFWSASEDGGSNAWYRRLGYDSDGVELGSTVLSMGLSVRCLQNK
jgi:uncharacterized protein (TIGR02145 family)